MALIYALIFLIAMAVVAGIAIYIARNVEHGEARFDSDTGEVLKQNEPNDNRAAGPAVAAQKIDRSAGDET